MMLKINAILANQEILCMTSFTPFVIGKHQNYGIEAKRAAISCSFVSKL